MLADTSSLDGCPISPQRTWAEIDGRSPSNAFAARQCGCGQRIFARGVKALEKHRFRPMYAEANMGHPSRILSLGRWCASIPANVCAALEPALFMRLPRAGLRPHALALLIALMIARSAAASPTPADPRIGNVIAELEKTRKIRQAALSPDGQMIAWAVDGQTGHRNSGCTHGRSVPPPPLDRRDRGRLHGRGPGLVAGQQIARLYLRLQCPIEFLGSAGRLPY